ncbi:MAG: hypothetical protein BWX90_00456 [bacterium ADurb.Bin132]|nr:MAG: hypothetical protein BWX90_00456 [bacterium ADurb.Bin132]
MLVCNEKPFLSILVLQMGKSDNRWTAKSGDLTVASVKEIFDAPCFLPKKQNEKAIPGEEMPYFSKLLANEKMILPLDWIELGASQQR